MQQVQGTHYEVPLSVMHVFYVQQLSKTSHRIRYSVGQLCTFHDTHPSWDAVAKRGWKKHMQLLSYVRTNRNVSHKIRFFIKYPLGYDNLSMDISNIAFPYGPLWQSCALDCWLLSEFPGTLWVTLLVIIGGSIIIIIIFIPIMQFLLILVYTLLYHHVMQNNTSSNCFGNIRYIPLFHVLHKKIKFPLKDSKCTLNILS
jgi:hypothetical protein